MSKRRTEARVSLRPTRASLVTLAAVGLGSALLLPDAGFGAHGHGSSHAGLPVSYRVGDVELTVERAERLTDGHAGTNSPRLPMGGPAMPMVGSGHAEGATTSGQERVAVSVRMRNAGADVVAYDARDLELTARGRPVELLRPVESTLGAGALPPGARITGQVYFVIADGTQDLALRHEGSARRVPLPDDAGVVEGHEDGHDEDGHGH